MSMKSELKEKFARRVPVRDIVRVRSGSSARYVLRAEPDFSRTVTAAETLARRGLSLLQAKRIATRLVTDPRSIAVEVPKVEDVATFEDDLARLGIVVERRDPPDKVNVKAIREALGLSQEEFAIRFGLDAASLRNWEQGRTSPELAVRSFLRMIQANPGAVESALSMRSKATGRRRALHSRAPARRKKMPTKTR